MTSSKKIMPAVLLIILATGALGYAQPRIPKEDIPSDVREQIERLYSDDPAERSSAAWALGKIGDKRAVEPLIAALKDGDSNVRKAAADSLRTTGWQPANAFQKSCLLFAEQAWGKLAELGKEGVDVLIAGLKDENLRVRGNAAWTLGKIGDKRAVEPLLAALKDKESNVRRATSEALGKIGDKRAVEPLIAALKDEDSNVQRAAAEALGKIGDKRAVEPLIAAFRDKDSHVRNNAAEVLGKIGKPAVEPLIAVLRDKDSHVRNNAAEALRKITGKDFGEDQAQWQRWWERNKASSSPNSG